MWVCILLAALGLVESVAGADPDMPFSIFVNVTGWSPFVFYVDSWEMNRSTGSISSANARWASNGQAFLWVVGSKYTPYGTVEDLAPELVRTPGKISYQWGRGDSRGSSVAPMLKPYPAVGPIAEPGNIGLGPYYIFIEPERNTTVTIDYITIEIPIATQAPNEEALRAGASTAHAAEGSTINKTSFAVRQFDSQQYANHLTGQPDGVISPIPPTLYNIRNDSVVLQNYTELTYTVPANTSLINVTGPVYDADLLCYFALDPEPWWWSGGVLPSADPSKPEYRPNQTLILLPVDPAVKYELIIGASGKPCAISGVTTYSYNDTTPSNTTSNSTSTGGTQTKAAAPTSSTGSSEKSKAGVIAGAVVGAVAGVALLALLAFFLFRRCQRQKPQDTSHQPPRVLSEFEPTEDVQVIVPFATPTDGSTASTRQHGGPEIRPLLQAAGLTNLTPQDISGGEKAPLAAASDPGSVSNPSGSSVAAARSTQRAEDMEDAEADQLLPPEYKEAWGQRHSAALEDAGAVSRSEKRGLRAEDGTAP